jgi:carboxypeptidase family protein
MVVRAGLMNWKLDSSFTRFTLVVAASLGVTFSLTPARFIAAQTKDYPQPVKSPLGQISGRVSRSDTGEPIAKAQVQLSPADPETSKAAGSERIVRTGPDGTFVFLNLPAGNYGVTMWRNGFLAFSPQEERRGQGRYIALSPGEELGKLDLRLVPTEVIAGQVSDEDQEPVQGLEVFALRINFQPGGRKQVSDSSRTVTDDLGNFRLPNLLPGSYYVSAGGLIHLPMREVGLKQGPAGGMHYRNTFYPATSSLDEAQALRVGPGLDTNDVHITVPTERTYSITGKVHTGAGRPTLKDAEVRCQRVDAAGYTFEAAGQTVQLATDHSFTFSSLDAGDYILSVKKVVQDRLTDLGFASVHIVDSNVHADVEVGRAAQVQGRVQSPEGLSVTGKKITLEIFGSGFYLLHQSPQLDASGRFAISNLPPGEYTFAIYNRPSERSIYIKKADCGGQNYAGRVFPLTIGTTLDCDLTLGNDTGVVHGEVRNGENPATGIVVVLIPQSGELRRVPRYTLTAKTDRRGQYNIAGVIPGDYLLFAVPPSLDHGYFALDLPERYVDIAEHVSVDPSSTQAINLKSSKLEP